MFTRFLPSVACAVIALAAYTGLHAAELVVGPDEEFWTPSEAANYAQDGDTIIIREGSYEDCAVWSANDLTIKAEGEGAQIYGRICQDKGLWVTQGRNISIENVIFRDAESPDDNGAGIRAEGANLTLRNVSFIDNQMGILTTSNPQSALVIQGGTFRGNGVCANRRGCGHGIYANKIKSLVVEDSNFIAQQHGHHIKSRAFRTEILNSEIMDTEKGTSSYLIDIPNGGDLVIKGNIMQKGYNTSNASAAIAIGFGPGGHPTNTLMITDNRFRNRAPNTTNFVENRLKTPAVLINNRIAGDARPLRGRGDVQRRRN